MHKLKVVIVAGARPNFIKVAMLIKEFNKHKGRFELLFVHTGQHYSFQMSKIFFQDLNIPKPDKFLDVGSYSHAVQTAKIMTAFEKVLIAQKPDLVIVVGDVNSTLACALCAAKINIPVAHVEAGLRSFDRSMPEEINRILTDTLSDFLFVSEKSGMVNLKHEGADKNKIFFVGNIMIDALLSNLDKINASRVLKKLKLVARKYAVVTLHRPDNVDTRKSLLELSGMLRNIAKRTKVIFAVHPRTMKMFGKFGLLSAVKKYENLEIIKPLGYLDFIKLVKESSFVVTDSGGIQEETTVLGVPCFTLRDNTERPVTITKGTNCLVNKDNILKLIDGIIVKRPINVKAPELWDGRTAARITKVLSEKLKKVR